MPTRKIRRNAKRKPYTFNVNGINNQKKKRKQRKKMGAAAVEEAWVDGKTTKENLAAMGLAYDPNKTLPLPSTKDMLRRPNEGGGSSSEEEVEVKEEKVKSEVVEALEREASKRPESRPRVSEPEVLYAVRMIERHGDDYQAMARDPSNHYQDTPKQIRRKIEFFKRTHQYQAYLTAQRNAHSKNTIP